MQRGTTIGGVLLGIMIITLLGVTLAAVTTMHLNLTTRSNRAVSASNLARSAVSMGIARVLEDQEFGKARKADSTIVVETEQGRSVLCFDQDAAKQFEVPYSTNNLDSDTSATGSINDAVPSGSIHLVARGESGGIVRVVEAVLRIPPYPWAIASAGNIETRNGVLVGSLPPGVWPPPPPEELLSADILANSDSSEAIKLGENSTVLGNVETPGGVKFLGDRKRSVIEGELRTGIKAAKLPEVKAQEFDPQTAGKISFDLAETYDQPLDLSGTNRRAGDLTVLGKLTLSNALLYVDGNLRVRGGIKGTGVLVATGNIEIEAGANLEGATEIAVLADGKVALKGTGPASSTIRGVFIAGEGFVAEELTLVGSLLAGNAASGVSLDHVNLLGEEPKPITVGGDTTTLSVKEGPFHLGTLVRNRDGGYSYILSSGTGHPSDAILRLDVKASSEPGFLASVTIKTMGGGVIGPLALTKDDLTREKDNNGNPKPSEFTRRLETALNRVPLLPPGIRRQLDGTDVFDFDRMRSSLAGNFDLLEIDTSPASGVGPGPNPVPESITTIYNISQFIPIEDRIRVVTWYEH